VLLVGYLVRRSPAACIEEPRTWEACPAWQQLQELLQRIGSAFAALQTCQQRQTDRPVAATGRVSGMGRCACLVVMPADCSISLMLRGSERSDCKPLKSERSASASFSPGLDVPLPRCHSSTCIAEHCCSACMQRASTRAPAVCACATCSRSTGAASWRRSRSTRPSLRHVLQADAVWPHHSIPAQGEHQFVDSSPGRSVTVVCCTSTGLAGVDGLRASGGVRAEPGTLREATEGTERTRATPAGMHMCPCLSPMLLQLLGSRLLHAACCNAYGPSHWVA